VSPLRRAAYRAYEIGWTGCDDSRQGVKAVQPGGDASWAAYSRTGRPGRLAFFQDGMLIAEMAGDSVLLADIADAYTLGCFAPLARERYAIGEEEWLRGLGAK
jgi:hypothetical protein